MLPCLPGGDGSHLLGTLVLPTTHTSTPAPPTAHTSTLALPTAHIITRNHLWPTVVLQQYLQPTPVPSTIYITHQYPSTHLQPTPVPWYHWQPILVSGTTYRKLWLWLGKVRMCPVPKMEDLDTWGRAGTRAKSSLHCISCTSWCGTQTMDLVAMALCSGHSPFLRLCEKVSLHSWVGNRGFLGVYWGSIMFSDWHLGRLLMARALRGDQVTLCPS